MGSDQIEAGTDSDNAKENAGAQHDQEAEHGYNLAKTDRLYEFVESMFERVEPLLKSGTNHRFWVTMVVAAAILLVVLTICVTILLIAWRGDTDGAISILTYVLVTVLGVAAGHGLKGS